MRALWIVASDFDRTLSHERDSFKLRDDLSIKINQFSNIFKFFVVTGREERFIKVLAPNLRPTGWVLENGALIIIGERKIINAPEGWFDLREDISRQLNRIGVKHSLGEVIIYVNSWKEARDFGRNVRVEMNRGDAMILPEGVDKGRGLIKAIKESKSEGKIIAVGDAENDEALFRVADIKVAVRNALSSVKEQADFITEKEDGEGVAELLDLILSGNFSKRVNIN
ncbi:MAG: phosphoglycolate phosphatase [Metallosphaera sp.]|uniref:phosphoglycolate phosphatase n=1 Tax=Metallosphaera sp. TaxID=2020860 RepID=UPI0031625245